MYSSVPAESGKKRGRINGDNETTPSTTTKTAAPTVIMAGGGGPATTKNWNYMVSSLNPAPLSAMAVPTTTMATTAIAPTTTTTTTTTTNQNKRQTPEEYDQIVTKDGNVAHIPKTNQDETKVNKMLKLQEQFDKKSSLMATKSYARMEGESKNAYNKRTRAETRQIIKQTNTVKNHEKLARKKEFLKQKKKRKKGGASALYYNDNNNNDDDDDDIRNNDKFAKRQQQQQQTDHVRFGEQADRPPIFRQIPRGAKQKTNTSTVKAQQQQTTKMSEQQVRAENKAMELMRRRIQAQYKAIKTQRKENGDFHL